METKDSRLNKAMAHAIKVARVDAKMTVEEVRLAAGLTVSTMNRVVAGSRDINVTQIGRIAGAIGVTPSQLVKKAVAEAGGMEAIMSEVATTNDLDAQRAKRQATASAMTPEELEAERHAATTDPEMDTDEPDHH